MQRMKLHMRGLKVPPLGSPRDRIYRAYLVHEQRLEAKHHEMSLFMAVGLAPSIGDRREWVAAAKRSFDSYAALLWGQEPQEHTEEEKKLLDYYTNFVKKSTLIVRKRPDGTIEAAGDIIDILKKT